MREHRFLLHYGLHGFLAALLRLLAFCATIVIRIRAVVFVWLSLLFLWVSYIDVWLRLFVAFLIRFLDCIPFKTKAEQWIFLFYLWVLQRGRCRFSSGI
jgi:hypothetical protein